MDLQLKAESGKIFSQTGSLGVLYDEAVFRAFGGVGSQNRKYHAGRLAALPAIGPGQELQHFENQGLGQALIARFDLFTFTPGLVNLLLEPLQDLVRLRFILQGINRDPIAME